MRNHVEDGTGFSGLLPSAQEKLEERDQANQQKGRWGEYDETEQAMYRDILEYIDIYGEQAGWLRVKQVCRMAIKGDDPREILRKDEARDYTNTPAPKPTQGAAPLRHKDVWAEKEQAAPTLMCNQCGRTETPPFDDGDKCSCGGMFVAFVDIAKPTPKCLTVPPLIERVCQLERENARMMEVLEDETLANEVAMDCVSPAVAIAVINAYRQAVRERVKERVPRLRYSARGRAGTGSRTGIFHP